MATANPAIVAERDVDVGYRGTNMDDIPFCVACAAGGVLITSS